MYIFANMVKYNQQLGERIKEARKRLDLTQDDFSKKLDISKGFVAKVEKGHQQPSAMFLMQLFKTFDISIDWLLSGRGQKLILPEDHILNRLDDKTIQILELMDSELTDEEKLYILDGLRSNLRAVLSHRKK